MSCKLMRFEKSHTDRLFIFDMNLSRWGPSIAICNSPDVLLFYRLVSSLDSQGVLMYMG